VKIHWLPPFPPAPPPIPERLRPTQLQAELAAEELIELAEKRRSEAAKRIVSRDGRQEPGSDGKEQQTKPNSSAIDVLV
jgi:hypothetical protein